MPNEGTTIICRTGYRVFYTYIICAIIVVSESLSLELYLRYICNIKPWSSVCRTGCYGVSCLKYISAFLRRIHYKVS